MRIRVRLFAVLKETTGRSELELELADGATAAEALSAVGDHTGVELGPDSLVLAVNREYSDPGRVLADGDELALIPPVSGGAAGREDIHALVTPKAVSPSRVTALVGRPEAGAVVTFQGTTRDVDHLDYEAYPEMAQELMERILREAAERHGLEAAAAEHRTGAVALGEPSVVVAVSAAHREAAFAGAREAIDRIKAELPIWKTEVEGDQRRRAPGTLPKPRT